MLVLFGAREAGCFREVAALKTGLTALLFGQVRRLFLATALTVLLSAGLVVSYTAR